MAENFDLIFGQSASSQYAWSDGDYQNGWQTVGSTPPTAEQFDALQRKSDTKAKDLNDRLSPIEEKAEADGRQAATTYTAGAMLTVDGLPNGWLLECVAPGISGTDAITLPDTLIDGLTIIDGGVTWALREVATNGGIGYRQPSTAYTVGNIAYHASLSAGWCLKCTTAGTTSAGDITPSSTIGDTITDGGVTWTVVKYALTTDVPPLASALATPRKIELTGNVTGSADFDGSKDIQIATSLADVSALAHSLLSKTTAADMRGVIEANAQNCGGIVAESLTNPGYVKFANGLLIEWGSVAVNRAPGADGIDTAYHAFWVFPVKMSVCLGSLATDIYNNFYNPQPFCIWAIHEQGFTINCKEKDRTAFVLAIGIA